MGYNLITVIVTIFIYKRYYNHIKILEKEGGKKRGRGEKKGKPKRGEGEEKKKRTRGGGGAGGGQNSIIRIIWGRFLCREP